MEASDSNLSQLQLQLSNQPPPQNPTPVHHQFLSPAPVQDQVPAQHPASSASPSASSASASASSSKSNSYLLHFHVCPFHPKIKEIIIIIIIIVFQLKERNAKKWQSIHMISCCLLIFSNFVLLFLCLVLENKLLLLFTEEKFCFQFQIPRAFRSVSVVTIWQHCVEGVIN